MRAGLNLRIYRDLDRPAWGWVVREGLLHDLRADPPALIHVQEPGMIGCGLFLARRLKIPAVATFPHAPARGERPPRFDSRLVRLIAISRAVAVELAGRHRVPPARVRVIHSGVDADAPPDPRTRVPVLPPDGSGSAEIEPCDRPGDGGADPARGDSPVLPAGRVPVVGTAGPLEVPKGLPYFLGAAARVRRRFPRTRFLLSGSGPEEANLRRLAERLDLEDAVTFAPNLLDFSASLGATDVFCLPSLSQGLGATMLEAMARRPAGGRQRRGRGRFGGGARPHRADRPARPQRGPRRRRVRAAGGPRPRPRDRRRRPGRGAGAVRRRPHGGGDRRPVP